MFVTVSLRVGVGIGGLDGHSLHFSDGLGFEFKYRLVQLRGILECPRDILKTQIKLLQIEISFPVMDS